MDKKGKEREKFVIHILY